MFKLGSAILAAIGLIVLTSSCAVAGDLEIGVGETTTLTSNLNAGNLIVNGTLDAAGHSINVSNITMGSSGSIINAGSMNVVSPGDVNFTVGQLPLNATQPIHPGPVIFMHSEPNTLLVGSGPIKVEQQIAPRPEVSQAPDFRDPVVVSGPMGGSTVIQLPDAVINHVGFEAAGNVCLSSSVSSATTVADAGSVAGADAAINTVSLL